jgi:hypothetical protein
LGAVLALAIAAPAFAGDLTSIELDPSGRAIAVKKEPGKHSYASAGVGWAGAPPPQEMAAARPIVATARVMRLIAAILSPFKERSIFKRIEDQDKREGQ